MSWYAWQNRLLADYIQWRFNKKIEALEHQNEEITYENVGWVRKMKIWKRRVRRSRLEKLSLTSPPEALRWVDTSELAGNPRTEMHDCLTGAVKGQPMETPMKAAISGNWGVYAVAPWAAQSRHLSVGWAAGGWQSQQWRCWAEESKDKVGLQGSFSHLVRLTAFQEQ